MWSRVAGLVQATSRSTMPRVIRLQSRSILGPSSSSAAVNYQAFQLKCHYSYRSNLQCTRTFASNVNTPVGQEEGGHIPGHFQIMFTCNLCETRTSKRISKQAYYNGIVIIRCSGCDNHHLIADNYDWFGQGKRFLYNVMHLSILYPTTSLLGNVRERWGFE